VYCCKTTNFLALPFYALAVTALGHYLIYVCPIAGRKYVGIVNTYQSSFGYIPFDVQRTKKICYIVQPLILGHGLLNGILFIENTHIHE
jgi:hypothetical protein